MREYTLEAEGLMPPVICIPDHLPEEDVNLGMQLPEDSILLPYVRCIVGGKPSVVILKEYEDGQLLREFQMRDTKWVSGLQLQQMGTESRMVWIEVECPWVAPTVHPAYGELLLSENADVRK